MLKSDEFLTDSCEIFGYAYTDNELKGIRDLFKNASKCYFYRLNSGEKAKCTVGEARYSGTRGNQITIVISKNESIYTVDTYFDGKNADSQEVESAAQLEDNAYVVFKKRTLCLRQVPE